MIETAPAYVGANFFLKIISANIKNPFKKFIGKAGYNFLIEKEEMPLCRRIGKVRADTK